MTWQGLEGHDAIAQRFARMAERGRLASAFLFVGSPGVGKQRFAVEIARVLLCSGRSEAEKFAGTAESFTACGRCPDCLQVTQGVHPYLLRVSRPEGKSMIPVDLLIGSGDKRMREGLLHDLSLKAFRGSWKVAIIDDADYLNAEGANALLKTLEEPPPHAMLILVGTSADKQLPTIRSRCQIVRFAPLEESVLANILLERGIATDAAHAHQLAALAEGSVSAAEQLADADVLQFRGEFLSRLNQPDFDPDELAAGVQAFSDAGGKEAAPRRARARLAFEFAAGHLRQVIRDAAAAGGTATPGEIAEIAARRAERTLDAWEQVDRNLNLGNVIAAWADEIWRMNRTAPAR